MTDNRKEGIILGAPVAGLTHILKKIFGNRMSEDEFKEYSVQDYEITLNYIKGVYEGATRCGQLCLYDKLCKMYMSMEHNSLILDGNTDLDKKTFDLLSEVHNCLYDNLITEAKSMVEQIDIKKLQFLEGRIKKANDRTSNYNYLERDK